MEKRTDQHKETWGHVEPGPLTEGEAAALKPLQENAACCENVKPTNMDPEPAEGGSSEPSEEDRTHEWQMLSAEEKKKFEDRKNGFPKN